MNPYLEALQPLEAAGWRTSITLEHVPINGYVYTLAYTLVSISARPPGATRWHRVRCTIPDETALRAPDRIRAKLGECVAELEAAHAARINALAQH